MSDQNVAERVDQHLARIYPDLDKAQGDALVARVLDAFGVAPDAVPVLDTPLPGADEVMLITYGDSIVDNDSSSTVRDLAAMLDKWCPELFSTVHVLPFFASSSDGGFSVVDYRRVADGLGSWSDISDVLGASRHLMFDLVCNHGSAQSEWFDQFRSGSEPGRGFYKTVHPDADTRSVVRPRMHPLVMQVDTADGPRHVWATFSHDQIDFDFSNPDVLVEFCSILRDYHDRGADRVRLDAIAYLWKELGTSCIHLPQTHEVVKLFRTLSATLAGTLIITETNVPHDQNVSYFGDGDEAQVVYNFTLAPLLIHTVLSERAETITGWLGRLVPPPPGCTFLNFIASHDGVGLRPIEDFVTREQIDELLELARAVGGDCSMYSAPAGPRPYELNVSLADLLAGTDGAQVDRFVAAHALMLAVAGIPALYVHSLLFTPGDLEAVARTEHKRDINRPQLEAALVDERLSSGWRADAFVALTDLIRLRRAQPAFAPDADQIVHVVHPQVVALERVAPGQRIIALHNISGTTVECPLIAGTQRHDLISGTDVADGDTIVLQPWQAVWLTD